MDRRRSWPVLIGVLSVALMAIVVASLLGRSPSQEGLRSDGASSSTGASSPSTATTGSPAVTDRRPAGPTGVAEAVGAFKAIVDDARDRGAIEPKEANDLRRRADEIARDVDDPKKGDVAKKIDELRKKVDDLERTGGIATADVANALRAAIDDIEAAAEA